MKRLTDFVFAEFFNIFNPVFFGFLTLSLAIRFGKIYETGGFNLPVEKIFLTILLILPSISVIIMPLAFLISVSITTTKLSSTCELTALQTSGVPAFKVFKAYLYIAFFIFTFYFLVTLIIKPFTNLQLRKTISQIETGNIKISPQEKNFTKISENLYIYCDKADKHLENIILFQQDNNNEASIIFSKTAEITKDSTSFFNFYKGNFFKIEKHNASFMDFEKLSYNPFFDSSSSELQQSKGSLSTLALWNKIYHKNASSPEMTEFVNRFFSPLSVFIFLLLAFPFSISHSRNYKTVGITISIFVGLFYFIVTSFANTFSQKGFFNPMFTMPLVNVVLLSIGIYIFYKKIWKKA